MGISHTAAACRGHGPPGIYAIGPANPFLGQRVKVRWLRAWGGKPEGYEAEGELKATFVVNGRTLIGEIRITGPTGATRVLSCPWSRRYLAVEP